MAYRAVYCDRLRKWVVVDGQGRYLPVNFEKKEHAEDWANALNRSKDEPTTRPDRSD